MHAVAEKAARAETEKAARAAMARTSSITPPPPSPRDEDDAAALHAAAAAAAAVFAPAAALALRLTRVVCTRLLLAAAMWVGAASHCVPFSCDDPRRVNPT